MSGTQQRQEGPKQVSVRLDIEDLPTELSFEMPLDGNDLHGREVEGTEAEHEDEIDDDGEEGARDGRSRARRQRQREKAARLAALVESQALRLQELETKVAQQSSATTGSQIAMIEEDYRKTQQALAQAEAAHAAAVERADGKTAVAAMKATSQLERRLEQLQAMHQQARTPPQQPLDPRLAKNANAWIS